MIPTMKYYLPNHNPNLVCLFLFKDGDYMGTGGTVDAMEIRPIVGWMIMDDLDESPKVKNGFAVASASREALPVLIDDFDGDSDWPVCDLSTGVVYRTGSDMMLDDLLKTHKLSPPSFDPLTIPYLRHRASKQ